MKECLLVGIGGMLGSIARYLSSGYFIHTFPNAKFPWGTFFVNLLGCFIIGLIAGLIEKLSGYNSEIRLICITGFLGGFTTFSAFGIESLHLLKGGDTVIAVMYVSGSVVLGILLAYLGLKLGA